MGRPRRVATSATIVVVMAVALTTTPPARAGGDFLNLAVGSTRVWLVGEPGVRELDARAGQTVAAPVLANAAYPLSVTLAGGAAWVSSVENGYVDGTLSRIDLKTRTIRVVWHRHDASLQYVDAGAGGIWALIGSAAGDEIARFSPDGRLARVWKIPNAGRMAADASGCWISSNGWLLRIDPAGNLHRIVRAPLGDVTVGAGAAWLPETSSVLRVDERTGRVTTLHTGPLRLGGFQHDFAVGESTLWAFHEISRTRTTIDRFDPRTGRKTGSVGIPGIGDALVSTAGALWVASVISAPGGSATGYDVMRIDPLTLRRTLVVHIT